ncbi:hypothetical protein HDE74_002763 [Janthinobacterium sp. K2Li3]|nr:hypothetical protein [Janthinobacterium sp. K2C7]MBB5382050.1 hypothetical protein [Janthinobacterium sp. K2Li3]MBB5386796.1 hypothetical protein [Janthinobacterium sp. K2E3]
MFLAGTVDARSLNLRLPWVLAEINLFWMGRHTLLAALNRYCGACRWERRAGQDAGRREYV